jgi:hypothetical protein
MSKKMGGRGRGLPGGNNDGDDSQGSITLGCPDEGYTPSTRIFILSFLSDHLSFPLPFRLDILFNCPTHLLHYIQSRPTHGVSYAICYVALVRIFNR